jgi:hypothetical protein
MTDQVLDPQQYWQIQLPIADFLKSKYQFGDRVVTHWEDDLGNHYSDVGVIIGMEYIGDRDHPAQWYYRIRFLKCDHQPSLVGSYDQYYEPESNFVTDNTVSEH